MTGIVFILMACVCWALDTLIRYPLLGEGITALDIVFFEHVFLAVLFIPSLFKIIQRRKNFSKGDFFSFLMIGGLGSALSTLAFTKAFTVLNPSLVILLQKLQPVVAITFSYLLLKEKIDRQFLFWAFVCIAGGVAVSYQQIFTGFDFFGSISGPGSPLGLLYAIVAVFGWGCATVFGKKLSIKGFSTTEIMGGRFLSGLVVLSFFIPLVNFEVASSEFNKKLLLMIFLSGVLGMFFYYRGLNRLPAKVCTLAELFFPLCAVIVNWLYLNSTLDWIQIIGAAILVFGSTVIQFRKY